MRVKANYSQLRKRKVKPGRYIAEIRGAYDKPHIEPGGKQRTYLHWDMVILGTNTENIDGSHPLYMRRIVYATAIDGPFAFKLAHLLDAVDHNIDHTEFDTADLINKKLFVTISDKSKTGYVTGYPEIVKVEPLISREGILESTDRQSIRDAFSDTDQPQSPDEPTQ